jgi:phosphoribosylanthranilate isomerase
MWTKICGIRDVQTARAVAEAGADAIGLNFYAQSKRVVELTAAADIVAAIDGACEAIGVFVNQSADEIRAICRKCGLRMIQLHGDELPEQLVELAKEFRVIRAFRVGDEGLSRADDYLADCQRLGAMPWACLIDACVPGSFGGTGHTSPWEIIRREYKTAEWPPLILAGGLKPDTVAQAIAAVSPWGVDVAGGVESSVACKEVALVRHFVLNAKSVRQDQLRHG